MILTQGSEPLTAGTPVTVVECAVKCREHEGQRGEIRNGFSRFPVRLDSGENCAAARVEVVALVGAA
ncbi:hypothetical protein [Kineosporia babensis]|uniref:Uncharacterized protein n=1 Tax=Kineosporia babensis TaxID=499548 RepID=A0A9X1SSU7_9ACTN|nr:hypothetical protein [Kineosporia babensis]MCD5310944.1 hypothetical protein [Kineosporia babensis]